MDDLNKQQVILLAILVSIVTSIATGITTVSLVAQNEPKTVTQTVNRIIEKTVERVVEVEAPEPETIIVEVPSPPPAPPEKEVVTVVVREDDQAVEAVAENAKSTVRIYESDKKDNLLALGFVIREDGMIYIPSQFYNDRRDYKTIYKGIEYELKEVYEDPSRRYIVMSPKSETDELFVPIKVGNSDTLRIGQAVIALSGTSGPVVTKGIVNSLNTISGVATADSEDDKNTPVVTVINTSTDGNKVVPGATLIGLNGAVVGVRTGRETGLSSFSAMTTIREALSNLPANEKFVLEEAVEGEMITDEV